MWLLWVHRDNDHLYILYTTQGKFQPKTNIFPGNKKATVSAGQDLKNNNNFSSFKSSYHRPANRKKLIFLLKKYFKTFENMIIGIAGT